MKFTTSMTQRYILLSYWGTFERLGQRAVGYSCVYILGYNNTNGESSFLCKKPDGHVMKTFSHQSQASIPTRPTLRIQQRMYHPWQLMCVLCPCREEWCGRRC